MLINRCFCTLIIAFIFMSANSIWIETTQEDFRDGCFDRNLYISVRNGGTVEFSTCWELNGDEYIDIVVSNERSNISYVYWGSAGGYSASNCTEYPVINGGDAESADLDLDGYPELIFSSCTGNYIRVFRGTNAGPDPADYFDLLINVWNESCCVDDCDKDGYLDIITGCYNAGSSAIYWGSAEGYSPSNIDILPSTCAHNFETADFNKDGWLDILFEQQTGGSSIVYWGSATGYNYNNTSQLTNPGSNTHGSSVADLNGDGYLDIVLTCFLGSVLYIYAGSDNGFTLWQTLSPGSCYGGSSIADFNKDGYLDIVCIPGYGIQQKPIIYWGTNSGYSQNNKTDIGIEGDGSGLLVADFDLDGHFDVLIHNYAYPPQSSYILMGPGFTPQYNLPTGRDHHSRFREIGNIYNRHYYEDYISSVFDSGEKTKWYRIEWDADIPDGTDLLFWVRSGNTPVPDESWSVWESVTNGGSISAYLHSVYFQYKARFTYTSPVVFPKLEEVRISYAHVTPLISQITIEPDIISLGVHHQRIQTYECGCFKAFIVLPPLHDPFDINSSTVECEGALCISGFACPDGYTATFNVHDLVGVVPGAAVEFVVTGALYDGNHFWGCDTVMITGSPADGFIFTPNPFRNKITFNFSVVGTTDIKIDIFDITGRAVRDFDRLNNKDMIDGLVWDRMDNSGRPVPAGIYFIKVVADELTTIKKVVILD